MDYIFIIQEGYMISFVLILGCIDGKGNEDTGETEPMYPETGIMQGITEAHNVIRRGVGAPDLTWDEDLVTVSEEWIAHLDQNNNCNMEHNWDSPLGENLFWANYETSNQVVVDSWASEVEFYDYESNECEPNQMCGHYTQLVWSSTERVGCAMMPCSNESGYIWMCNYDPGGNYVGERPY
jgi:pathogenesis-related protein 1